MRLLSYKNAKRLIEIRKGSKYLSGKTEKSKNIEEIFRRTIFPMAIVEKEYFDVFMTIKKHGETKAIVLSILLRKEDEISSELLCYVNSDLTKREFLC